MSTLAAPPSLPPIVYPESDGLPMAENTLQYQWIVTIVGGLRHLFDDDPDVFVAGDLFWYPVEGHPEIRLAPDAMVAFGRPWASAAPTASGRRQALRLMSYLRSFRLATVPAK